MAAVIVEPLAHSSARGPKRDGESGIGLYAGVESAMPVVSRLNSSAFAAI